MFSVTVVIPFFAYASLVVFATFALVGSLYLGGRLAHFYGMNLFREMLATYDARLLRDTLRQLDAEGKTRRKGFDL